MTWSFVIIFFRLKIEQMHPIINKNSKIKKSFGSVKKRTARKCVRVAPEFKISSSFCGHWKIFRFEIIQSDNFRLFKINSNECNELAKQDHGRHGRLFLLLNTERSRLEILKNFQSLNFQIWIFCENENVHCLCLTCNV